jgi:hypothetical protein
MLVCSARAEVERVVLNALARRMRLCSQISAPSVATFVIVFGEADPPLKGPAACYGRRGRDLAVASCKYRARGIAPQDSCTRRSL